MLLVGGALLVAAGTVVAVAGLIALVNAEAPSVLAVALGLPIGAGVLVILKGMRTVRAQQRYEEPDWLQSVDLTSKARKIRLQATSGGKYATWVIDGNRLYDREGRVFDLNTIVGGTTSETNSPRGWTGSTRLKFQDGTTKLTAFDAGADGPNQRLFWEIVGRAEQSLKHKYPGARFGRPWTDKILTGFIVACMALAAAAAIGVALLFTIG